MISIVICSTHPELDASLQENIRATIGVAFEIVLIDNSNNEYNIFSAYNEGVKRAKGDILCFMHQDVRFHSTDWGRHVEFYLSDHHLGILGLAGGSLIPAKGDWRFKISSMHMLQGYSTLTNPSLYYTVDVDSNSCAPLSKVAVIDGVWFCVRRELFVNELVRFDENNFHGFHLYDSDICMQVNKLGLDIAVCSGVRLEHFSDGVFSRLFLEEMQVFLKKWEKELPVVRGLYMTEEEIRNFTENVDNLLRQRVEEDEKVMAIRLFWEKKDAGFRLNPLPIECKAMIEAAQYDQTKRVIKSRVSEKDALNALRNYRRIDNPHRYYRLLYYFIVYRFFLRCRLK